MFEDAELFIRSSGESSEVVTKQMYDFRDKGDRHIALKPEGTAPAIRAYLEHSLGQQAQVTRLWYFTPIFRFERPQKGRYRQSHQAGIELIGSSHPNADAEVIEFTVDFYRTLGLTDAQVRLNSIGRTETRARFGEAILAHMAGWLADQDEDGKARALKNPMRLLDSKDPKIQEAIAGLAPITSFLDDESKARFEKLQELLTEAGVEFILDPAIVRGLDYYTETVYEVQSPSLGAQSALSGGGRYDNLIAELGGPATPAVGFAAGLERALIVMDALGVQAGASGIDAFLVGANSESQLHLRKIARALRAAGFSVSFDLDERDVKRQLKAADRMAARFALIFGHEEVASGHVAFKQLSSGEQIDVPEAHLISTLRKRLVE